MRNALRAHAVDAALMLGGACLIVAAFLLWLWLGLAVTGTILIAGALLAGTAEPDPVQPGLQPGDG